MDDKATIQENGEPWHYMYLVQNSAPVQGKIMAQFRLHDLKAKTAAILYNSQHSYSVGMAIPFEEVFTAGGGQIIDKETYTSADKDFRPQLTKIKAANPDIIYFPSYPVEIPLIYTQAYELGITVPMLGSNSVLPTGLAPQTDPAATTNTYFPYGINTTEPELVAFAQEYKAKFGIDPVAQAYSGYDAFGVLVQAISACGEEITSECINKQLNNIKDFQGFQGSITISPETHQPVPLPMAIMTIKEGKPEFVKWYTPEGPLQ
jgi:branched-chain amino acid transport system substrate-binding protein